jgi:hypothetical protein
MDKLEASAREMFEAANGGKLVVWSDATREYWLDRAMIADARLLHLARIGAAVVAADDETRTSFVKFDKKALDRLQRDIASLAGE